MKLKKKLLLALALTMPFGLGGCSENKKLSEEKTKQYVSFLNTSLKPVYKYRDLYITDADIAYLADLASSSVSAENCTYEVTDIDETVDIIKENTEVFCKNHKDYGNFFENDDDNEKLFRQALEEVFDGASNVTREDFHKLSEISVTIDGPETDFDGLYNPDLDTLTLWPDNINGSYEYDTELSYGGKMSYRDFYKHVIKHELEHVRQEKCACRTGQKYDSILIDISDDKMIGHAACESSAESYIGRQDENYDENEKYYTYSSKIEIEKVLWLLSMFNDNEVEDYYNSLFDSDLSKYYEFFGVGKNLDLSEFAIINYSLEGVKADNYLSTDIQDLTGANTQKRFKEEIGMAAYYDVFRIMVRGLISNSNRLNLSLEEDVHTYLNIKDIILKYGVYTIEENGDNYDFIYEDEFVEKMDECEELYKDYLKEKYDASADYLETAEEEVIDEFDYTDSKIYKKITKKFPIIEDINRDRSLIGDYLGLYRDYKAKYKSTAKNEMVKKIVE